MMPAPAPAANPPGQAVQAYKSAQSLEDLRSSHSGAHILVCGLGASIQHLPAMLPVTIGVNDIGRRITTDYVVVVNPASQFSEERFRHIAGSGSRYILTQYSDLPVPPERRITFRLGTYNGIDFANANL